MKSKYFFLPIGVVFIAVAIWEGWHAHNEYATTINAVTGAIFLFLGIIPPRKQ